MSIQFSSKAWEDYLYWQKTDKKFTKKINTLIQDISRDDPYTGLGKPEPLKHAFSGYWSRRISDEHRMIYRMYDDVIQIVQLRYHY